MFNWVVDAAIETNQKNASYAEETLCKKWMSAA